MFYTIDIFTRPSESVPFFGATQAGKALKRAALTANRTVLLGQHTAITTKETTVSNTLIRKWVDKASYDAFMTSNATANEAFIAARDAYNKTRNITMTATAFSSPDLLF